MSQFQHHSIQAVEYRDHIFVYVDGSCIDNGMSWARAGYGVYFPDPELHCRSDWGRLQGYEQTSNRAELQAVIRALEIAPMDGRQLVIFSDSKYAINCVGNRLDKWRENGFRNSRGAPVHNQDLIQELDYQMGRHWPRPQLEYVKGHAGHRGNELADGMAKAACNL